MGGEILVLETDRILERGCIEAVFNEVKNT